MTRLEQLVELAQTRRDVSYAEMAAIWLLLLVCLLTAGHGTDIRVWPPSAIAPWGP